MKIGNKVLIMIISSAILPAISAFSGMIATNLDELKSKLKKIN